MKNVSLTQEKIVHNYRDVFTGLGKLPGTYHIDMDPNTKPVQENPRRVPIPVKDELKVAPSSIQAHLAVTRFSSKLFRF